MVKRPRSPSSDILDSVIEDGAPFFDQNWLEILILAVWNDPDHALHLDAYVQDMANFESKGVQRLPIGLPSFSEATVAQLEGLGLHVPKEPYNTERPLSVEGCVLPVAFQVSCAETATRDLEVLGGIYESTTQGTRGHILHAYWMPIVELFKGCIYDRPEASMECTLVNSVWGVEHELHFVGGASLIVAKLKQSLLGTAQESAQLFAEMYRAALLNERSQVHKGRCVYGVLTDIVSFYFFEYNPATKTFVHLDRCAVSPCQPEFFDDMAIAACKIFALIFSAYIGSLEATIEYIGKHGLSDAPLFNEVKPDDWAKALRFAQEARVAFKRPVSTIDDLDQRSIDALELLKQSAECVKGRERIMPEAMNTRLKNVYSDYVLAEAEAEGLVHSAAVQTKVKDTSHSNPEDSPSPI